MTRRAVLVLGGTLIVGASFAVQTLAARLSPDVVEVDAVVVDGQGRTIDGLPPDAFSVRDDGRVVTIDSFDEVSVAGGERGARTVVVVLDDSGVPPALTSHVQRIASLFVNRMGPADQVSVVRANNRADEAVFGRSAALTRIAEYPRRRPALLRPRDVRERPDDDRETFAGVRRGRTLPANDRLHRVAGDLRRTRAGAAQEQPALALLGRRARGNLARQRRRIRHRSGRAGPRETDRQRHRRADRRPRLLQLERLRAGRRPDLARGRSLLHDWIPAGAVVGRAARRGSQGEPAGRARARAAHEGMMPAPARYGFAGGREATYAAIATMSSSVRFATTSFMSCADAPFLVPCCMSQSWRTR